MVKVQSRNMRAHFQNDDGGGQSGADPEAPRHVDPFELGTSHFANGDRLERHAADRASARRRLPNLRMHRAGVNGSDRRRLWLALVLCQKLFRLLGELGTAAGRTKKVKGGGKRGNLGGFWWG